MILYVNMQENVETSKAEPRHMPKTETVGHTRMIKHNKTHMYSSKLDISRHQFSEQFLAASGT
jgi:hypothetical protein